MIETLRQPRLHEVTVPPPHSAMAYQPTETDHEEGNLLEDSLDIFLLSSHFQDVVDEAFYARSLTLGDRSRNSSPLAFAVEETIPLVVMNESPTLQSGRQTTVENQSNDGEERHVDNQPLTSEWLPYTMRPGYLLLLALLSTGLEVIVLVLTWLSTINKGLSTNNNSIALLFGWRFGPTLVAVTYSIFVSLLLQDVKRTESFASLSQEKSSFAKYTLLRSGGFW